MSKVLFKCISGVLWTSICLLLLGNLTWQRFWMKKNYDNNKEFKITRIFHSKIYMCSVWSLVSTCFSFLLRLFLHRENMVSTNNCDAFIFTISFLMPFLSIFNRFHMPWSALTCLLGWVKVNKISKKSSQ